MIITHQTTNTKEILASKRLKMRMREREGNMLTKFYMRKGQKIDKNKCVFDGKMGGDLILVNHVMKRSR